MWMNNSASWRSSSPLPPFEKLICIRKAAGYPKTEISKWTYWLTFHLALVIILASSQFISLPDSPWCSYPYQFVIWGSTWRLTDIEAAFVDVLWPCTCSKRFNSHILTPQNNEWILGIIKRKALQSKVAFPRSCSLFEGFSKSVHELL